MKQKLIRLRPRAAGVLTIADMDGSDNPNARLVVTAVLVNDEKADAGTVQFDAPGQKFVVKVVVGERVIMNNLLLAETRGYRRLRFNATLQFNDDQTLNYSSMMDRSVSLMCHLEDTRGWLERGLDWLATFLTPTKRPVGDRV